MKILEIIPQLSSGGGERFTVDLCNELSKRHKVKLIVLLPLDKYGFYLNELSDKVEVVSMNKGSGFDMALMFRILNEIICFKPDIVHTHLRALIYVALSAIINKKIKFFHTIHNDAQKEAGDIFSRFLRKFLFNKKIVTPIAISDESLSSFIKFYGFSCPKIINGRAIPQNINISREVADALAKFKKTSNTRILVNLARIMKVKRQPFIASICQKLLNEGYDFRILFIGRGEDAEILNELKLKLNENIIFLGEKNNPIQYLKMADGYCLFSEYEGMPISLIEALATKTVPICTPVGGIVDTIQDGKNGILAKDLSEKECYMALKRFLDLSDTDLDLMKREALKSFKSYSMIDCVHKYENLFLE